MFSMRETRRWFLKAAGSILAALSTLGSAASAAAEDIPTTVYILDPNWGSETPGCTGDCHACNACQNHAQHRRFATALDAHQGRAHPGCKCLIRAVQVTAEEYVALFGEPGTPTHRGVHDDRTATPRSLKWRYVPLANSKLRL